MKNKITLSGFAGSGKSSVGKIISKKLDFEFTSVGNYSRTYAKENYGLTINQFQDKCKENPELDQLIDDKFKKECNQKNNVIIDYRLGFHFVKNAFNVFLKVSDKNAVARINSDNRNNSNETTTATAIKQRNSAMKERFKQTYKVDFINETNYHLVIDTNDLSPIEISEQIIRKFHEFKQNNSLKTKQPQLIPSINYHLWEPCNMRCKFCFATFQDVKQTILPKGHLPELDAIKIVKKIAKAGFKKITFAGGEPLLCKWLPNLIKTAKELGMTTMIVTNGSKLTDTFLLENTKYLDWIAVSVDSLRDEDNIKIGRAITGKKPLNKTFYYQLVDKIKQYGYGLKINTVVNQVNYKEDLTSFIEYAKPKRWKVLQVLPIVGQNDIKVDHFKITDKDFNYFLETHKEIEVMIPESNNAIKGSYVMVDPAGRFFDNAKGTHNYSKPILKVGIETAYNMMNYDGDKFEKRGGVYNWENNNFI